MSLITPIKNFKVTSEFGPRTINGKPSFHRGRDFAPNHAGRARVRATRKCQIVSITRGRKPGDTSTLNSIRPGVTGNGPKLYNPFDVAFGTEVVGHVDVDDNFKVGDWLLPGQEYGWTDLSGNTDGYHVHYEIHPGTLPRKISSATAADPAPYFNTGDDMATLDQDDLNNIEKVVQKYVPKPTDQGARITQQESIDRTLVLLRRIDGKIDQVKDAIANLPTGGDGTVSLTPREIQDALAAVLNTTRLTTTLTN